MKVIIKTLPLSKNKFLNKCWQARGRYKKEISKEIYYEMLSQNTYNGIKAPFKKAEVTFKIYFRTNARRDIANYLGGGLIAVLDSLVDLGIILDDNHNVIGNPKVEIYKDKENPRCEIIIEEVTK